MTKKARNKLITNAEISMAELFKAYRILTALQQEIDSCDINTECTNNGFGPFRAAIYDSNNNLIAKASNSVVSEMCSNNHAEMNVIRIAQQRLKTYDLSSHNLSLYITAEPCMMCAGAILWSGIKRVFYSVPSSQVEEITSFDEGFKFNWLKEFSARGISVYGNIATSLGEQELKKYIEQNNEVYKPSRL